MQYKYIKIYFPDLIFLSIGILFIIWGRWYSIVFPFVLNVDEAQMAANALRISAVGWNWDSVDGATSGPLNSILLLWPTIFDADVTLSLTRLTAGVLVSAIFVITYCSINTINGRIYAIILSLPIVIFYAMSRYADYIHYSSELLPLFLAVISNFFVIKSYLQKEPTSRSIYFDALSGISLGAIFFAKLQAVPIATVIFIFYCYVIYNDHSSVRRKRFLVFFLYTAFPYFIFFSHLIYTGGIFDFYYSYIGNAFLYTKKAISILALHNMAAADPILRSAIYFYVTLIFTGCFAFLFHMKTNRQIILSVYFFILLAISIFSIVKPGRGFPHYLMLLVPFLALFANILYSGVLTNNRFRYIPIAFCSILLVFFFRNAHIDIKQHGGFVLHFFKYATMLPFDIQKNNPMIYSWLVPENSKGLVWGWMPQWYLLGDLVPAGRETHNEAQIRENSLTQYYRDRHEKDLENTLPDIIIDAVSKNSFKYKNPALNGIRNYPYLKTLVDNNYINLSKYKFQNEDCPKIYIRKEHYEKYMKHIVPIRTIEEQNSNIRFNENRNLSSLNDYSVTEDVCADYWIVPDGAHGSFVARFDNSYSVAEVKILNTRNGYKLDKSTTKIKYTLLRNGQEIYSGESSINPHPMWTAISIPNKLADALMVEILSYDGYSGGLNEVKVFHSGEKELLIEENDNV